MCLEHSAVIMNHLEATLAVKSITFVALSGGGNVVAFAALCLHHNVAQAGASQGLIDWFYRIAAKIVQTCSFAQHMIVELVIFANISSTFGILGFDCRRSRVEADSALKVSFHTVP